MRCTSEAEPQTRKHVRFAVSGFGSAALVTVSACPAFGGASLLDRENLTRSSTFRAVKQASVSQARTRRTDRIRERTPDAGRGWNIWSSSAFSLQ